MNKIYVATAVVLTIVMNTFIIYKATHKPPKPQPIVTAPFTPITGVPEVPVEVDKKNMEINLRWLADDAREGRMSGKKGNKEAANYIKEKFESYGLETRLQPFSIKKMNAGPANESGDDSTSNVIGVLKGETDKKIVIGGHFDHVGYGPSMALDKDIKIHNGADDNASGTTAVLELAKVFSKTKPRHTMIFICFSGEEMGLLGSKYYVSQLSREEISSIDLMINFDMVGRMAPKTYVEAIGAKKVPVVSQIMSGIIDKYNFKVKESTGDGDSGSDHAPFGKVGVPFVFFFTGMHPQYHKITDKADLIDFNGLYDITRFTFEVIREFDKTQVGRNKVFDYNTGNHSDHGHVKFPN